LAVKALECLEDADGCTRKTGADVLSTCALCRKLHCLFYGNAIEIIEVGPRLHWSKTLPKFLLAHLDRRLTSKEERLDLA
jgi:hypothetical protein